MKTKLALLPFAAATGFAAYVALHPGVAYAEPCMANLPETPLQAGNYTIDPMHAIIGFEITHLGLSQVHGRFDKFTGKIHENPDDLGKSSVEFSAMIDSIDTDVEPRDTHLKSADFFDAAKYPNLIFKSTKVEKTDDGYQVTGDLTIKDKTKAITIPFKHHGPYTMPKGIGDDSTRIGIVAAPITIKRSDFGVGAASVLPDGTVGASDEVIIHLSFEALLDK